MIADCPKIKALAPWFGGKRTLAPRIVELLGPHKQYFEPFCGGLSVLFAKEPAANETVNDLHGDVINLARVLQDRELAVSLHERLQGALFSEDLLHLAEQQLQDADLLEVILQHWPKTASLAVDRAYHYFLASWITRNGVAGTARLKYQMAVRWTSNGGSPTTRLWSAVASIPAWHERLLNVVILRRNAFDIIDRFEDVGETAIYADPPYPGETRTHGAYLHEFNHSAGGLLGDEDDHEKLARLLRQYRKARIVVSSYDCPRVRELYAGWSIVECAMNKQLAQQNRRGEHKQSAPEILLVNGPISAGAQ